MALPHISNKNKSSYQKIHSASNGMLKPSMQMKTKNVNLFLIFWSYYQETEALNELAIIYYMENKWNLTLGVCLCSILRINY